MPLSWNEIRDRAHKFAQEWEHESSEDAEAKTFWDDFFNVFGVPRRRVASFEQRVKKLDGKDGFIDLLWKGVLLVEHKSRGRNLSSALLQALEYFPGLKDEELPRYILTCDFARFHLHDLDTKESYEFDLSALAQHIHHFGFLAGYEKRHYKDEDPVNIKAAELMGALHDSLRAAGYEGHPLSVFLVRMLFCLFADDTGIFERGSFYDFIHDSTREDGTDTGSQLTRLYQVLNTPPDKRMKTLDETLAAFPYINGRLFEEPLALPDFNSTMRSQLLKASALDWGSISPGIFGSLFQSVMNPEERRKLGAHYTSEKNILKVINPLFMDDLRAEFESIKLSKPQLQAFHTKIAALHFLDPACGCGNFLVVAYRELRLLEIEVLRLLVDRDQQVSVDLSVIVNVDQFCGIEIEEFPCQIAQVAMWLIDHQMNMLISNTFGTYYLRLPLTRSANIIHTNALRLDWEQLGNFEFVFGNPPFIGKTYQSKAQKSDLIYAFEGELNVGSLDFVTGWFAKAAKYIMGTDRKSAFVSTSSISQGEQVGVLWKELAKYGCHIFFAHRSFKWSNDAKGVAAVHVVIIGLANRYKGKKRIFEYSEVDSEPHEVVASNINPYLVDSSSQFVVRRTTPISGSLRMIWGNKPVDGGFLIIDDDELANFVALEPQASKYIKRLMGAEEFLYNKKRWCLWLVDATPDELRSMPHVKERIEGVRQSRLRSKDAGANKLANSPSLFRDLHNPDHYIVVPEISSERRKYIPIDFLDKSVIPTNRLQLIPDGTLWEFGILCSIMHNVWVRLVCGRLESRFTYSNSVVYNNFPFPTKQTEKHVEAVRLASQNILDARTKFSSSCLADLYDPLTMPPVLAKAHEALDKAVDKCYRSQPFESDSMRIEFLFSLYEEYTAPLIAESKKSRAKKRP